MSGASSVYWDPYVSGGGQVKLSIAMADKIMSPVRVNDSHWRTPQSDVVGSEECLLTAM